MKGFVIILFFPFYLSAQVNCRVVGIIDGDTFTALCEDTVQIKVRLASIDCPEKGQPFSSVCKKYLSDLIFAKTVLINKSGLDRYGRIIANVYIDSIFVNEKMIEVGLAWHFVRYDNSRRLAELENQARKEKRGLWIDPNPTPPWEWRKSGENGN